MDRFQLAYKISLAGLIALNVLYYLAKIFIVSQGLEVRWLIPTSLDPQLGWLASYGKSPMVQKTARFCLAIYKNRLWLLASCVLLLAWSSGHILKGSP